MYIYINKRETLLVRHDFISFTTWYSHKAAMYVCEAIYINKMEFSFVTILPLLIPEYSCSDE